MRVNDGDQVARRLEEGKLRAVTLQCAIRRAQDAVRRYVPEGRSLVDELISERRREGERE